MPFLPLRPYSEDYFDIFDIRKKNSNFFGVNPNKLFLMKLQQDDLTRPPLSRDLSVHLTVTNALDGASRLLCDVQRFGFSIRSIRVDTDEDDLASVQLTLKVQPNTDVSQITSRFARHACVLSIESL